MIKKLIHIKMKTTNEQIYEILSRVRMDVDIKRLKEYIRKHPEYQKNPEGEIINNNKNSN